MPYYTAEFVEEGTRGTVSEIKKEKRQPSSPGSLRTLYLQANATRFLTTAGAICLIVGAALSSKTRLAVDLFRSRPDYQAVEVGIVGTALLILLGIWLIRGYRQRKYLIAIEILEIFALLLLCWQITTIDKIYRVAGLDLNVIAGLIVSLLGAFLLVGSSFIRLPESLCIFEEKIVDNYLSTGRIKPKPRAVRID